MDDKAIQRLRQYAEGRERMGHSAITEQRRRDVGALLDLVTHGKTDWTRIDPNITRVEIIDDTGRAFVRYYETAGVELHVQDEGRTLKVFARTPRRPRAGSPDYWCNTCNRGAEGCTHSIEEK